MHFNNKKLIFTVNCCPNIPHFMFLLYFKNISFLCGTLKKILFLNTRTWVQCTVEIAAMNCGVEYNRDGKCVVANT